MTRYVEQTNLFKRQVKLAKKRGQNIEKLQIVIQCLIKDNSLSAEYRDHKLVGNFGGCRECHIEPAPLIFLKKILRRNFRLRLLVKKKSSVPFVSNADISRC